jgi:hypothetical protein
VTEVYFSQIWTLEFKIRVPTQSGYWWALSSWVIGAHFLAISSSGTVRQTKTELELDLSLVFLLIPFVRTPHSWPNYLPKAPFPNTIILGVRVSAYAFGGTQMPKSIVSPTYWWGKRNISLKLCTHAGPSLNTTKLRSLAGGLGPGTMLELWGQRTWQWMFAEWVNEPCIWLQLSLPQCSLKKGYMNNVPLSTSRSGALDSHCPVTYSCGKSLGTTSDRFIFKTPIS